MISPTAVVLQWADDGGEIDPETGHGPEWGKAAPIALLIIVLLGIALVFLIRSMNKQMRKVPASFEDTSHPDAGSGGATATAVADSATERPLRGSTTPDAGGSPPTR